MANLNSPAINITAVKQEPPQSPPSLPPPEPIMQPISFASLIAAIKQELLQPPHSLPPPSIILRPSLAPSTPIIPPSQPPPTPSLLYPNLVPSPSIQPPTPIPQPPQFRPNLVPPPLAVVKTEPDQPQPPQQLQPPPSLPPPPIILRPSLAPSTPIIPPSQPPPTSIPTPSLIHPNLVPSPSLQPPTPIPPPSQFLPNLVTPPLAVVKTEQDQLQPPPQQQQNPQFLKSINDLSSLSKSLNAFNSKFEDLTNHIVSINQAIDSKFNDPPPAHTITTPSTTPTPQQQQIQTQQPKSLKPTETKTPKTNSSPRPPRASIQSFCLRMRAKFVRKYIISNLQDISKLREEIPEALKLAPEPAKLVLDCIGQFFVVGHKACMSKSYTITARKAFILLLDIFGTFHGRNRVIVSVNVKGEAEKVAIGWRKRLIREGGIDKAGHMDAKALLLFVACFGIPRFFSNVDLGYLFKLSKPKGISGSLKSSPFLPCRIPDIIHTMAKNGMHFKALEVASIFGFEGKFSPGIILNSLLPESTKAFEMAQQKAHTPPFALKEATENHLVVLRLTVRCLEDRGDDGTLLLGSLKIKEKIVKLEEEIAELDKRIAEKKAGKKKKRTKRKSDQMGSSSTVKSQEVKRLRSETEGSPLPKSNVDQLCEQSTAAVLAEGDGLITDCLNGNNNYPAVSAAPAAPAVSVAPAVSAAPHGSSNGIGQVAGTTGVGSSGLGVMPESSYSVKEEEIEVDEIGQTMSGNGLPYKWQQGCVPQSTTMWFASLFGSSPSVEGFVGVLDSTVRTPADRYRFADSLA